MDSKKSTTAKTEKKVADVKSLAAELAKDAKNEATKATTAVKEEVNKATSAVKKEAAKATTSAKNEATKATTKATTAVKKEAVKATTAVKKTATKATAAAKKTEVKKAIFLQYMGQDYKLDDITSRVEAAYKAENKKKTISEVNVYIKPEENAAYYVVNGCAGKINL